MTEEANPIFSRIRQSRTADEVAHQIEAMLLEGVLRVGDRLPGERELARQFDVSRPVLRAALKSLESRGLLVTRHGGGSHVADVIGQVFAAPIVEIMSQHPKATADYLEYRREVEGIAAEYAARRATGDDRALLDRIVARMDVAHGRADFEEEAALDVEFHNAVGECTHNIVFMHTLRSCYRLLADGVFYNRAMIYRNLPTARDDLLAQHRAIHAAIAGGDPAGARRAAQDHIDFVEKATAQAERAGDWQRVSRLRLSQRSQGEPRQSVSAER